MRTIIFRILYFIFRALRTAPAKQSPPVFLVLQYQMPLGCCVHGTPIYSALKTSYPDAKVIVATRGLSLTALQHDPHIDHLIGTGDPAVERAKVVSEIRSGMQALGVQPTQILQDATNRAGSFALLSAMVRLAPTKGFAGAPPLYDEHLAYDPSLSLIANNLRLVPGTPLLEPAIYFTRTELLKAQSLLPPAVCRIAFVMQGSGGQRTSWHDDRFAAVLQHVAALGHQAVLLGTTADAEQIDRILQIAGTKGISLAGKTSIPELAAVLANSDLLVSIDTGTMHVGRAVDVPLIVLGPSWQKPLEWLPLGKPNARILRGKDRDSVPANYRLDEIEVAPVIAAIEELLTSYPPSLQAREQRIQQRLSTTRE